MNTLNIEAKLAQKYGYKPLPKGLSEKYRQFYIDNLPKGFKLEGSKKELYSTEGSLICSGYNRIVVGDYGAFVELDKEQANESIYIIAPGQEYRVNDPKYSKNVKYIWMTVNDGSNIKIYKQKKRVVYADYKSGMFYISPHECLLKRPSYTKQGTWCDYSEIYCKYGPFSDMSDWCDDCLNDDEIW